ncbi:MAG: hypothetical protein N2512_13405 [Armatimonadetes bacterium]|nr:hypothetical protein [Armatimonadota bacterium]
MSLFRRPSGGAGPREKTGCNRKGNYEDKTDDEEAWLNRHVTG